ncbi:MAG: response regulator [Candidatus Latescibacteria bacterium]|nr:response regulator [Candidatus Latescibacterota bacterium]
MAKQGSQEGQNERTPDQKAMDRARNGDVEQPSPDKGTEEGLPIDMRLQAGPDTASTEESEEDLASLLASFQEPEGDAKPEHAETEEDRELSRMISLMTSRAPGPVRPEETGEETSGGDETLEALPEGTEVIFDPSPEASVSEEDALAKMGAEASDTAEQDLAAALSEIEGAGLTETEAEEGDLTEVTGEDAEETEIASVAGDAILEEEAAGEEGDASEQASISTVEDELVESEAIEGYDVTDTVDALLSTIGLEEHEGASFAPPVPEGGIQDDGTPAEELVDDRILEDFRELHKGLHAPPVPAADGISALAGLSGGLAEGQARILCIDDDPDNRSLFKGILDAKDYTFIDAESGEEALEILREGEGDLVLLNLDIASQDGFELIEEAASDGTLSQIPILVNSASAEHIEKALRLGASDYFIHPMNVIDVKFQIPIKVKNLLKIRRAERMLSLVGGHPYADTMAVSPMEEWAEMETRDLPASGDETLSDLLEAGEEETLTASGETAGVSALEDLLKGDGEEDGEAEEDLTEKGEPLLGEEQEEEEGIVSEVAETEEDLVAALAESHEDLFDEEEKDEEETEEDLVAALAESHEDLFDEEEKDEEESEEDLTAALATEEENLDKLFDEEDPSDPPAGTDQTPDALKEIVGLGAAGAAVAAVGVATMRSEPESDEDSRSAADILAQPPRKGASPIWRSPDVNHSHRERILQQRRAEFPRMSGRRRLALRYFCPPPGRPGRMGALGQTAPARDRRGGLGHSHASEIPDPGEGQRPRRDTGGVLSRRV